MSDEGRWQPVEATWVNPPELQAELDALKGGMALLESRTNILQRLVIYLVRELGELPDDQTILAYVQALTVWTPKRPS